LGSLGEEVIREIKKQGNDSIPLPDEKIPLLAFYDHSSMPSLRWVSQNKEEPYSFQPVFKNFLLIDSGTTHALQCQYFTWGC
jgi:hypothetical protein